MPGKDEAPKTEAQKDGLIRNAKGELMFCPLRNHGMICSKDRCMWFNTDKEKCAINS